MRVAVGSTNPVKVNAVRNVFSKFFEDVEVIPLKVNSGVSNQPKNYEVITGAINRAKNAFSDDVDFSVGIEAGLFTFPGTLTGYLDFQFCAVYDGRFIYLGSGPGFEYPPKVIEEVEKGKEVGEVMEKLTGIENIGKKQGSIGYLTKGAIKRENLTELAVTMAIIPVINQEMYLKK